MAFLRMKSAHGHPFGDVYSCFQKHLRRGDLDGAMYWGAQIGRATPQCKGYPNALKKRLMQHALEDVGSLDCALRILNLPGAPTWAALQPWIHVLCEMPKTRAAAWFNRVAVEYVADVAQAPNDLLRAGATALRDHRDTRLPALQSRFGTEVMRLYTEVNHEVLAFHLVLLTHANVVVPAPMPSTLPVMTTTVDFDTPRTVPDWAHDKHTATGKRLGRGYQHFLDTMLVHPRLFPVDPFETEGRALYLNGKEQRVRHILAESTRKRVEKRAREEETSKGDESRTVQPVPVVPVCALVCATDEERTAQPTVLVVGEVTYTNVLQTQLMTSRSKPRSWFATAPSGRQVVIKGPMPPTELQGYMKTESVKARLGLPRTNATAVGSYLLQDCLVDYTALPTTRASSTLETNVTVAVARAVPAWEHPWITDPTLAYALFEALLLRKVVGTNDTSTRNFIVLGSVVYSIDDPGHGKCTPYVWKMKLVKPRAQYAAALAACWPRLQTTMVRWKGLLKDDDFAVAQLDQLCTLGNWRWA